MTYEEAIAAARKGRKFTREEYQSLYGKWLAQDAGRIRTRYRSIPFTRPQRTGIANGDRPKQIKAALKKAKRQMSAMDLADELNLSVESVREAIRWPVERGEVSKIKKGGRVWYEVAE